MRVSTGATAAALAVILALGAGVVRSQNDQIVQELCQRDRNLGAVYNVVNPAPLLPLRTCP